MIHNLFHNIDLKMDLFLYSVKKIEPLSDFEQFGLSLHDVKNKNIKINK